MPKKNKHERRNKKQEQSHWEDLVKLKDETVESLYDNSAMMKQLMTELKITISENPEVTKVLHGGIINFQHLAEAVNNNAKAHYETKTITNDKGEEEVVIDNDKPRKGVVQDLDYTNFFQIYNNYLNAQSHAVNLLSKYSMEIMTLVQEKKVKGVEIPDATLNKFKEHAEATTMISESMIEATGGDDGFNQPTE